MQTPLLAENMQQQQQQQQQKPQQTESMSWIIWSLISKQVVWYVSKPKLCCHWRLLLKFLWRKTLNDNGETNKKYFQIQSV